MICESHLWGGLAYDSHQDSDPHRCRLYSDIHSARGTFGLLQRRRRTQAKHREHPTDARGLRLSYQLSVVVVPGWRRKSLLRVPSQYVVLCLRLAMRPESLPLVAQVALSRSRSGLANAHSYGPRHHDGGHWVARLFLASPSSCGHTAGTPTQIVIAREPLFTRSSTQPRVAVPPRPEAFGSAFICPTCERHQFLNRQAALRCGLQSAEPRPW